jgi:anaerobic dimethyl sulfoxide reductase subunit A
MAAAVQAMTGNIGILGGCAEGVGKGWHAEAVAYPYDENANIWWASIKSDRWAHCVLNYPERQARGNRLLAARRRTRRQDSQHQGHLLARLGLVQPAHQHQQGNRGDQEAGAGGLHGFDHHALGPLGRRAAADRHALRAPRRGAALVQGPLLHPPPKVIEPMGESKTDLQVYTELAYRLEALDPALKGFGKRYNPRAERKLLPEPRCHRRGLPVAWWKKVRTTSTSP